MAKKKEANMWRPEGWQETRAMAEIGLKAGGIPLQALLDWRATYDEGADAMLEALIKKGVKTNFARTNSNPIYLTNPRRNGVYVFIPEEKTLGNVLVKMADIPERIKESNRGRK